MFERFSPQARAAVERAETNARSLGAHIVNPEHVALGLLEVERGGSIMAPYGLDESRMRQTLGSRSSGMPVSGNVAFSSAVPAILRQAFRLSIQSGSDTVDPRHLWGALLADQGVIDVMEQLNVDVAGARVGLQRLELQASQERMQRAQSVGASQGAHDPYASGGDSFSSPAGAASGGQLAQPAPLAPTPAPHSQSPSVQPQAQPAAPQPPPAASQQPASQRPAQPQPAQQQPVQQAPAPQQPAQQAPAQQQAPQNPAPAPSNPFDSASDEFLPSFDSPSDVGIPSLGGGLSFDSPEPQSDDPWAGPPQDFAASIGDVSSTVSARAEQVEQDYRSSFSGSDNDLLSNDPWGLPDEIPTFDPASGWPARGDDESGASAPAASGSSDSSSSEQPAQGQHSSSAGARQSPSTTSSHADGDYAPAPANQHGDGAYQPDEADAGHGSGRSDASLASPGSMSPPSSAERIGAIADPSDVDVPARMREPDNASDAGQPGPVCGFCGAQLDLSYGTFEVDGHAFQGLMCRSCHSLVSAWPAPLD